MRHIAQRGLWFEEFELDVIYEHSPGRTVTEADNVLFTTLTMNPQAMHLDAVAAAASSYGRPLVNGMFTLSTLVGLSVAQLTQGTLVANLGFSEVGFLAPMFHGDTLFARSTVLGKRLSNTRPGHGVVELQHFGANQHGVDVVVARRATLVRCQPEAMT
jgi:acyl dehydratase